MRQLEEYQGELKASILILLKIFSEESVWSTFFIDYIGNLAKLLVEVSLMHY